MLEHIELNSEYIEENTVILTRKTYEVAVKTEVNEHSEQKLSKTNKV
jgi:hypothetical protein